MTVFNYEYNGVSFNVANAVERIDDWKVVKSKVSSYEKQEVIVTAFEKDFPMITLLGSDTYEKFEFLTKVCSRSSGLIEWFAGQKLIYSELAQLPNYLSKLVEPVEYQDLKDKVLQVNKTIAKFSDKRLEASNEYKRTVGSDIW
jgi:hypothetical protein